MDRKQPAVSRDPGRIVVSRSVSCRFGFVSSDTLLREDATDSSSDVTTTTTSPTDCSIVRDCFRCRRSRVCCCCDRQLSVAARRTSTAGAAYPIIGPETGFDAWACWHCLFHDVGAETEVPANVIATGTGTRKDDWKADVVSVGTQPTTVNSTTGNSPRPATRENTNLAYHVNRAPAGNWWGSRGQFATTNKKADAESYEFFHCSEDDEEDDVGSDVDGTDSGSSAYAALYRDRYTVLDVGRYRLGEKTLNDLEPADDPYLRKFRTCGDLLARLQQLVSTNNSLNGIDQQLSPSLLTPDLWYSGGRSIQRPVTSSSATNTTFNFEPFRATTIVRSIPPSRSCSASLTNGLQQQQQQQRVIEENRRGGRNITRPEMAVTTSTPGTVAGNADNHLNLRTLYSKISSNRGESGRPTAVNLPASFDRSTTTVDMMQGMLSSLRTNCGNGVGVAHHQQRVAGMCVLSGALLVASPYNKTIASDIDAERSIQRSVSLLRPQLLSNRKQQQPQQQQQQMTSVKGSDVKTQRLAAPHRGTFVASDKPSTSSTISPFTPAADAAVDSLTSNGSHQRLHPSADGFESSMPYTGRIRHESMSGRQFQTIASRLRLAAVRAPPELSLLVRLA